MGPSGGPLPPPDKELASLTEQEGRRGRGLAVGGPPALHNIGI